MALKSDGSLAVWGDNHSGQCNVPSPNNDFVALAAGEYHSLGLKSDGRIVAWGGNSYGQCGVPSPNAGFIAVAAGRSHSLGLRSDGSIVAWGSNGRGQCNVPLPNTGFAAISGGEGHSLGLKSDGSVVAWGDNSLSQCVVPSPNTGFVAVAACCRHSLGLKNDGSIVAWGDNSASECNVPSPNTGFVAIGGGEGNSLGLKSDGSIVAWGSNAYGQCNLPAANAGFIAVAAGLRHALAIKPAALGGGGTDNRIPRWFGTSDLEDSAIYQTDAGNIGIGTTTPVCLLDVAGAVNLNKDRTGVALTVNGKEALWSNDTYFSWGYGGSANFFGDNVGIGPYATEPAERLDLSWSNGVNARIGRYNYVGSCHSSATFVLGNNARARTDSVNGIVVGNQHETYGYRAIAMGSDGIVFHTLAGKVTPGDPVASERVRITNDGRVGIGTTAPHAKLHIESGEGLIPNLIELGSNVPGNIKVRHYARLDSGYASVQGITTNYDFTSLSKDITSFSSLMLRFGASGVLSQGKTGGGGFTFSYIPSSGSQWTTAMRIEDETGNVGIGAYMGGFPPTEKLDVDGTARLRQIGAGSGTAVVADTNGKLFKMSSSRRHKTNIRELDGDADKVLDLRPVRFQWTTTGQEDIGLIAEEVDESMKDLVIYDAEGKPDAVKYDRMSLYLLQVVRDLRSENESLKQRLDLLESRMEKMERNGSRVAHEVLQ